MRKFISIFILFIFPLDILASPIEDQVIIDLAMANVACAAVQSVNPEAVNSSYGNFFNDSVHLYHQFHGMSKEKSEKNQKAFYKIITSENAVKAQSLNSVVGAKKYLSQYLIKTDANSCSELKKIANKVLVKYDVEL
ncbi:hypothetical protein [Shewanella psychromarinicola]|uniref:Uncharacterized protein n=1 Tax=Shewanella psychromarinicola TaxID=2487742 RepID=A0A3N4EN27_9GAMM|nr:hypothetical protein [Shewanella psychromarinicola]AZG37078.1 hypothetical protein EGC80_20870 [Shewanella psychromarinicola]MCL1082982.1 hypothetical protein [Shewanella psychromarinicola]RPA34931.1 hypothetical protein EGC77_04540 [Shewanella psychromarinicola]